MAKRKNGGPHKKPKRVRSLPNSKAFVLCEKIIHDSITNCPTMVGLFSELAVDAFPGHIRPFWLYLQLTDGVIGEYVIEIEVQDLDNGEMILRGIGGKAKFSYRPERFDVMIPMPPLLLEKPTGRCAVVAFADGRVLAENTFTVRKLEERK